MASVYAFSPGSINAEDTSQIVTVTGRGLSTGDQIVLEPLAGGAVTATCTPAGSGSSVALTVGGSVDGGAGARTLTGQVASVSALVNTGKYAVCVRFNGTSSFVASSTTILLVGELGSGRGGELA